MQIQGVRWLREMGKENQIVDNEQYCHLNEEQARCLWLMMSRYASCKWCQDGMQIIKEKWYPLALFSPTMSVSDQKISSIIVYMQKSIMPTSLLMHKINLIARRPCIHLLPVIARARIASSLLILILSIHEIDPCSIKLARSVPLKA